MKDGILDLIFLYSVLFHFGHICRWDQCAVDITYFGTVINPADDSPRGLKGMTYPNSIIGLQIQNVLWLPESEWPHLPGGLDNVSYNDAEVKKVLVHSLGTQTF